MYFNKLFSLSKDIPELNDNNLSNLDDFFGKIGISLFSKKDILSVINQKNLIDDIINWFVRNEVIIPTSIRCNSCSEDFTYGQSNCPICNVPIDYEAPDNQITYKLSNSLINSKYDIETRESNINKLLDNYKKLLCARINQKMNNKEKGYIVFIDLANSQKLMKDNIKTYTQCIDEIKEYITTIVNRNFLPLYKGILFNSKEADGFWIYLDDKESCVKFLHNFISDFEKSKLLSILNYCKTSLNINSYLKIIIASSLIEDKMENNQIEFQKMFACTYIRRIEKPAKTKILTNIEEKSLFPLVLISQDDDFGKNSFILTGIPDLEVNCECWFSVYNEISTNYK